MSDKIELVDDDKVFGEEVEGSGDGIVHIAEWYWVYPEAGDEYEEEEDEYGELNKDGAWFGCVIHVGSNYVEIKSPPDGNGSQWNERIHIDQFFLRCKREKDPENVIQGNVDKYECRTAALMQDVRRITNRLAVSPDTQLADASNDTQSLATMDHARDMGEYKNELVLAKKEQLPKLFDKIKRSNAAMASWMSARVMPMQARARAMRGAIGTIENRIFSVELYAGLVEEVEQITTGASTSATERVHMMQRRCYMDEESLANYKVGGMEYRNIYEFDKWIATPENRDRLLPFPRCIVSFQVRRYDKERAMPSDIGGFIRLWHMQQADKKTFLYLRNGDNVYRMSTELTFGHKLFPDFEKSDLDGRMWARMFAGSIKEIIPDRLYQSYLEEDRRRQKEYEKEKAKLLAEDPEANTRSPYYKIRGVEGRNNGHGDHYEPFDPSSVYYDDMAKEIAEEVRQYNRIALIVQGLFDRSPVFQPSPRVKMWTPQGFDNAVKLIYDSDRAINPADMPDFKSYMAELGESIQRGSMVVGQECAWERHEAVKYNKKNRGGQYHRDVSRHRPCGDPGPGFVAKVAKFGRTKKCTFEWMRERRRGYSDEKVRATFKVDASRLFHIDAYTPGDFRRFFDDPRTRMEYIEWAPLMLAAEEYHAGNLVKSDEGGEGLEMPSTFRPRDDPPPVEDEDDEDTEDTRPHGHFQKSKEEHGAIFEDRIPKDEKEIPDHWVRDGEEPVWRLKALKVQRKLKLIKRARELPPPKKEPLPGKRVKLGKGFDICCRQAEWAKPEDAMYRRYFLRKRSKKTEKRYAICMTISWDGMLEHMGWDKPDEQDS